ncbi:siderophore-interacting protein [Hydrogenophaga sp. PAMC20947]|uniref:siderophore-interacting protein n=1 Tax=Hydrogenophaga sp. PAMC20947 TaxID=2565558 RepID=UPI00109E148A|nr:siderophore-interacting protein [Hydrogenophaga sp. PAMC20947]QCB46584.1 siderophore-interacting protein [Hydrogenophaga sp. PAMC20947]
MTTATPPSLEVERLRHPLKVRRLQVQRVERTSPHFVRVQLIGSDLEGFVSASFDDHIKLMLPAQPGGPLVLPEAGPDGPALPPGTERPTMRDYTPSRFDAQAQTLDIEFLLHGEGRASEWAAQAQPGDEVGVGGPRGSFVVPTAFDWHLLVGDETALPAITRRLAELPSDTTAIAVIETASPDDRRAFVSQARVETHWVDAGAIDALAKTVSALNLPTGEGFAWAAGEAASMVAVREVLIAQLGLDKSRVRASAYWKRGSTGHHETL